MGAMETAHNPVCLRILLLDWTLETCSPIVRAGCDFRHRTVYPACPRGTPAGITFYKRVV